MNYEVFHVPMDPDPDRPKSWEFVPIDLDDGTAYVAASFLTDAPWLLRELARAEGVEVIEGDDQAAGEFYVPVGWAAGRFKAENHRTVFAILTHRADQILAERADGGGQ